MKRSRTIRSGKQPCLPLWWTTTNGVPRPEALRRAWGSTTPFDDSGRATHGTATHNTATSKAACGYVGFTLIEMLVAVTLVLLMMVMFGEMFQLASASVTKQRVMADNDQNARTFVTVIRADLDKRSFRSLVPFYANEPLDLGTPFGTRRGYFYISNNNLNDGIDDMLQFTVDASVKVQNTDTSPYFGRAVALAGNFLSNPNQPDRDDLQITPNEAGASRAAEIAYWMREGRLYRRSLLVRDREGTEAQPQQISPTTALYFQPPSPVLYTANFWNDFDYSAHRFAGSAPQYAIFHGIDSLGNEPPSTGTLFYSLGETWHRFGFNHDRFTNSVLNGLPREFNASTAPNFFFGRFTHQETSDPNFQYPHLPAVGIGALGNPMDGDTGTTPLNVLQDTTPRDGVIDQFANGGRVGVDLLLSHVQEFRVEVWDERLNDFVPVGHTRSLGGIDGDYHQNRQSNGTYGPLGSVTYPQKPAPYPALTVLLPTGQRFANAIDTWHPRFNRNNNLDASGNPILGDETDRPPYRPVTIDPTGLAGPTFTNPSGASLWWTPNVNYQANPADVVFPRREDLNGNGFLDPGEDGANGFPGGDGQLQENVSLPITTPPVPGLISEDINNNGTLDPGEDGFANLPLNGVLDTVPFNLRQSLYPTGLTFSYRCIRGGVSGARTAVLGGVPSIYDEPFTSTAARTPGTIIRGWTEDVNNNGMLDPGEDIVTGGVGVGSIDREPDWLVEYNVRPLRAIRITVRFEHPTSKQMKQITIVHSLRDTTSVP